MTTPTYAVLAGLWLQWHCDTFTPPAGAEVLAFSDAGPQALRIGRSFATQFHPEANEAIVTRWMSGSGAVKLATQGIMPSTLMEQTRKEVITALPKLSGFSTKFDCMTSTLNSTTPTVEAFPLALPWHFRDVFLSNPSFAGRHLLFPLLQIQLVIP